MFFKSDSFQAFQYSRWVHFGSKDGVLFRKWLVHSHDADSSCRLAQGAVMKLDTPTSIPNSPSLYMKENNGSIREDGSPLFSRSPVPHEGAATSPFDHPTLHTLSRKLGIEA